MRDIIHQGRCRQNLENYCYFMQMQICASLPDDLIVLKVFKNFDN